MMTAECPQKTRSICSCPDSLATTLPENRTTTGWRLTQGNIEGDGEPGRCVAIVAGLHSSFLQTQRLAGDEVSRLFEWKTSALCGAKVVSGMMLAG